MNNFYSLMVSAHSVWRWVVLILLLAAIFKAFSGWRGKKEFTSGDKKLAMFAMVFYHIQFLGGLILYFISPKVSFAAGFMKDSIARFFAMEHILLMSISMVLLTMGYSKSKRIIESDKKFKKIFVYYLISLLIVLASIPWPFRALGAGWF